MFSGIIETTGTIQEITEFKDSGDKRFLISIPDWTVELGASIAVNGVCLTVTEFDKKSFSADVSAHTLSCTTFGSLQPGQRVNLEKPVTLNTFLNGHLVSGHVDGIGQITHIEDDGRSKRVSISVPAPLYRYIVVKGSLCVDGISLTVNATEPFLFTVNLIPHTLERTTLQFCQSGQWVNIEVDMIARYIEKLYAPT